jgi:hypothetical protein
MTASLSRAQQYRNGIPQHHGQLSGQVCKFVGDQAAADWAPFGVWTSWCRSSRFRRSARSLVVNFHLKLRHEVARSE